MKPEKKVYKQFIDDTFFLPTRQKRDYWNGIVADSVEEYPEELNFDRR